MVNGDDIFNDLAKRKKYKILAGSGDDKINFISHRLKGISTTGQEVIFTVLLRRQLNPSKYSDNWGWVEFWNKRPTARDGEGRPGWLYGKANFIAFETSKRFLIVSSKLLLHFLNTSPKVRYDLPFVNEPKHARYRILRDPRGRESTQINYRDIRKIEGVKIWNKD